MSDRCPSCNCMTDEELAAVIAVYGADLPHAFQYLNFIDSYFEQRKRKHASEAAK